MCLICFSADVLIKIHIRVAFVDESGYSFYMYILHSVYAEGLVHSWRKEKMLALTGRLQSMRRVLWVLA